MRKYSLTPEEYKILTTTHFSLNNPSYYANLDYVPFDAINDWLTQSKKITPKVAKIAAWFKCVNIYKEIVSLTGIPIDLMPAHTFLDIIVKSNLITTESLNYSEAVHNLINCTEECINSNWDYYFILNYLLAKYKKGDSLWLTIFKDIGILTYKNKEYFYKMFYYLTLTKLEVEQLASSKSDLKLVKKCINTWAKLFKKQDPINLIEQLATLLKIECNNYLVECICGADSFYEISNKAISINSKCEQILGLPIGTHYKKAKAHYLQLIKINHPDRHPDNFEFYSKKTAEINQAWKEWREYNEF